MSTRISEKIRYVGVNDHIKTLFEGLWPLPYGVSYNSYLIIDKQIALIDTVDAGFEEEYISGIRSEIGDRSIDYLIINHMEPDHSSLISLVKEIWPKMRIVTNAKAAQMLKGYHNIPEEEIIVVKDRERLSLGDSTLSFHMTPMVHWPETMMTWFDEESTLFSGDAFGTFGAVDGGIRDAEAGLHGDKSDKDCFARFKDEMIRYYSNIVGKYGIPVQTALKKLSGQPIKRICSTHGPVWEIHTDEVVALYDKLSRYDTEHGVCIVYASMYGNTAAAARSLAEELILRDIPVAMHDLCTENPSAAYRDLFKYDILAAGSPTYNNGILPPVLSFMHGVAARLVKNRKFFAFGSYTWSGASVNLLNNMATEMGFGLIGPSATAEDGKPVYGISFPQAYSPEKCPMATIADIMASSISE